MSSSTMEKLLLSSTTCKELFSDEVSLKAIFSKVFSKPSSLLDGSLTTSDIVPIVKLLYSADSMASKLELLVSVMSIDCCFSLFLSFRTYAMLITDNLDSSIHFSMSGFKLSVKSDSKGTASSDMK